MCHNCRDFEFIKLYSRKFIRSVITGKNTEKCKYNKLKSHDNHFLLSLTCFTEHSFPSCSAPTLTFSCFNVTWPWLAFSTIRVTAVTIATRLALYNSQNEANCCTQCPSLHLIKLNCVVAFIFTSTHYFLKIKCNT